MPESTAGAIYDMLPSPKASKQMNMAPPHSKLPAAGHFTHTPIPHIAWGKLCTTSLEYGQMLLHQIYADAVHF
jgi:hypothetical protein